MLRGSASILFLLTATTAARADDLSFQIETSVASSYVYRGIVQYSTRDVASSQNTIAVKLDHVGPGSLTVSAWNAVALGKFDSQPGNSLELDLSAAYAFPAGPFAMSAGYLSYLYPNHAEGAHLDGAHEVFVTASYANEVVVPTAAVYVEPIRQQGAYVMLAGNRDFHHGAWTFGPALSIGFAAYEDYLGTDKAVGPHVNDVTATAAGRFDIAHGMYASARVSYSLRGTPRELAPDMMSWGLDGRSSVYGVIAFGVAR